MFTGSVPLGGKLHSCRRAGMCMLRLISEDGKSIKLIKQALAYGSKSIILKPFQKQVVQSLGVCVGGWGSGGGNFGMGV